MDPTIVGSAISAGASVVGGVLGIGASKVSAKDAYKYNSKLMAQQQEYARENSATQYARQRELTADSWMLNKEGMRNAGVNPAFLDGSQNATANTEQAAAPSNPSMSVTTPDLSGVVQNGVQNLIAIQQLRADNRLKDSQSALNETKQLTALQDAIAELRIKKANASSAEAKAEIDQSVKDLRKQYEAMNIKNQALMLDNDRTISDIRSFYAPEEWNTRLQIMRNQNVEAYYRGEISHKDYLNYDKRLNNELLQGRARAALDYANASLAPTQIEINKSVAALNKSQIGLNSERADNLYFDTKGKALQNDFNRDSYSDRLSVIKKQSIPDNMWQKIQLWRKNGTFEKLDGFQQMGYGIYEALIASGVSPSDAISAAKLLAK